MKNYILKPHKRLEICKGNIWVIRANGIADCWRFIKDKFFFCVHFAYDKNTLLRNINLEDINNRQQIEKFVTESDICLGILTKRGNASVKSMLKVYKLESEYNNHMMKQTLISGDCT